MSCHGNNATPPSPAEAPGAECIDAAEVAAVYGRGGVDSRLRAVVPGFDAPFFQAGLAGYSDAAMRIIARRHGCPFCVTEALLDRMLLGGGRGFAKADLELIQDNLPAGEEDLPLAGQLIGSDPDEMAAAALKMVEQGWRGEAHYRQLAYARTGLPHAGTDPRMRDFPRAEDGVDEQRTADNGQWTANEARTFSAIDVNLACPVKKIRNKARGGHWLCEPEGAIEILKAVRQAVPRQVPCTVKLRRAFDDTPKAARSFERIFNAAYELGYAWATVHARTVEQKYIGPSCWPVLADLVRRYPDRLILGSGDVWQAADIFRMLAYTGVAAVAVARGCIGNPWTFRQARAMMDGRTPDAPTITEQREVLEDHFRLCAGLSGEHAASQQMRKFAIRFAAHHPRAEEVRRRFIEASSAAAWSQALLDCYGAPEPAAAA
jgi:tRNA-dihydrouridine synthase